jgi:hypothetical protein
MVKLFTIAWITLGTIAFGAYLFSPVNTFIFGGALLLAVAVMIVLGKESLRRRTEGYYVKTKGNADGGDVIYHEDGQSLTFYFDRRARTIHVPHDQLWEERMPEWARARKIEIVDRIKARLGSNWGLISSH